jgi:hypothetical protein
LWLLHSAELPADSPDARQTSGSRDSRLFEVIGKIPVDLKDRPTDLVGGRAFREFEAMLPHRRRGKQRNVKMPSVRAEAIESRELVAANEYGQRGPFSDRQGLLEYVDDQIVLNRNAQQIAPSAIVLVEPS